MGLFFPITVKEIFLSFFLVLYFSNLYDFSLIPCKKYPTKFFNLLDTVSEFIKYSLILFSLKRSQNLPPKFSTSELVIFFEKETKIIFFLN